MKSLNAVVVEKNTKIVFVLPMIFQFAGGAVEKKVRTMMSEDNRVRCNACMTIFEDEELGTTDVCPNCKTDGWLMTDFFETKESEANDDDD